jgi:hypothetical protein
VLALALPAGASAGPLLSDGDAAELANTLAEATEEQGICYGWSVYVSDQSGGPSGTEVGSNFGPGAPVGTGSCPKGAVVLDGAVTFTCGSCESEDSSDFTVTGTLRGGPTKNDLEDLGFSGGQLKNDNGDAALASMVGALPLVVSSKGLAPALTADSSTEPAKPAADKPTNSPVMPDWLRESWLALAAFILVIGGGIVWFFASAPRSRSRPRPLQPAPQSPPPPPASPQEET